MQITRQADYALRAILFLSLQLPNQKSATSEIAEKQNIPPSFLAKIISQLSIAGLIHTTRGAKGGVTLAKAPCEISMLDVIEAIDGPIALNECMISSIGCTFDDTCPVHKVWCELQKTVTDTLKEKTFDQLKNLYSL